MLNFLKFTYWKIVAHMHLMKLKRRFPTSHCPHLETVHLPKLVTGNIEENHKAYNTTQIGTTYAVIHICYENHSSLSDVLESLYHEYRHVMQYNLVDNVYIALWSALAKKRRCYYLASPIEVDAKLFAKTRGKRAGKEVFEEFGVVSGSSFSEQYVARCKQLADRYTLQWGL